MADLSKLAKCTKSGGLIGRRNNNGDTKKKKKKSAARRASELASGRIADPIADRRPVRPVDAGGRGRAEGGRRPGPAVDGSAGRNYEQAEGDTLAAAGSGRGGMSGRVRFVGGSEQEENLRLARDSPYGVKSPTGGGAGPTAGRRNWVSWGGS